MQALASGSDTAQSVPEQHKGVAGSFSVKERFPQLMLMGTAAALVQC